MFLKVSVEKKVFLKPLKANEWVFFFYKFNFPLLQWRPFSWNHHCPPHLFHCFVLATVHRDAVRIPDQAALHHRKVEGLHRLLDAVIKIDGNN